MAYQPVAVYDVQGTFLGYGVHQVGTPKLEGSTLYAESEIIDLNAHIKELNTGTDLRAHWPDARDPEVVALLDDPSFSPIEKTVEDVVDDENSVYVYLDEPDPITGEPGRVDPDNSLIVYKKMEVPKRPSDVIARLHKASEIVARKRAGLDA